MRINAQENPNNKRARVLAQVLREQGKTLEYIANELNRNGYKTSKGKLFTKTQVLRLVA